MKTGAIGQIGAVLVTAVALARPLGAEEDPTKERALAHLRAGLIHAEASPPRWREACDEFKAARADYPASWRVVGNIGTCLMNLERDGEAIEAYDHYLTAGGKQIDAKERREVEDVLGPLRKNLVRLTITTDPAAPTLTDWRALEHGGTMENEYKSLRGTFVLGLHPGRHTIKINLAGHRPAIWEVDLKPGATLSHDMRLEPEAPGAGTPSTEAKAPASAAEPTPSAAPSAAPAPAVSAAPVATPERRTPAGVYVGLAATGALAVGTTLTGLMALSKRSSFGDKNDGSDPAGAKDLRDSARGLYLVTDILLGATVVAGGITAYLYATRPERPAGEDHARIRIQPAIGPGSGWVAVSGRF
jgi:hypothetical protein